MCGRRLLPAFRRPFLPSQRTQPQATHAAYPQPHRLSAFCVALARSCLRGFQRELRPAAPSSDRSLGYSILSSAHHHKNAPPTRRDNMALPIYDADEPVPMTVCLCLVDWEVCGAGKQTPQMQRKGSRRSHWPSFAAPRRCATCPSYPPLRHGITTSSVFRRRRELCFLP